MNITTSLNILSGILGTLGFGLSVYNAYFSNIKVYNRELKINLEFLRDNRSPYGGLIIFKIINSGKREAYIEDISIMDFSGNKIEYNVKLKDTNFVLGSELQPGQQILGQLTEIHTPKSCSMNYMWEQVRSFCQNVQTSKTKKLFVEFDIFIKVKTTTDDVFTYKNIIYIPASDVKLNGETVSNHIKHNLHSRIDFLYRK